MSNAEPHNCLFCQIVAGALPASTVYEDSGLIAFLDIMPLFPGHLLVSPRQHVGTFPELPPSQIDSFFRKSQLLTRAVENAMGAEGTFLAINNVVSQTVPHLHLHIVPRKRKDGLRGFFWPRNKYTDDAHREATRAAIATAMEEQLKAETP